MRGSGEHVHGPWRYERIEGAGHWIPLDAPQRARARCSSRSSPEASGRRRRRGRHHAWHPARRARCAPSRAAAAGLVFVASGAVLVLEILGIRLLAPYVGLTLETTTTIIGTVLAGIAAGRGARRPGGGPDGRARGCCPSCWSAAALLAIGDRAARARARRRRSQGGGDVAALAITLVALLPARDGAERGHAGGGEAAAARPRRDRVGRRAAVGVGDRGRARRDVRAPASSIVPLLPTDVAVFARRRRCCSCSALGAGAARRRRARRRGRRAGGRRARRRRRRRSRPARRATPRATYHCARVVADDGPRRRAHARARRPAPLLRRPRATRAASSSTTRAGSATRSTAWRPRGAPLDAVFLGGGGFTLPRYLAATRPGSRSRVLEVDATLVELARERLGLRTGAGAAGAHGRRARDAARRADRVGRPRRRRRLRRPLACRGTSPPRSSPPRSGACCARAASTRSTSSTRRRSTSLRAVGRDAAARVRATSRSSRAATAPAAPRAATSSSLASRRAAARAGVRRRRAARAT